jgi:hypothetical protein
LVLKGLKLQLGMVISKLQLGMVIAKLQLGMVISKLQLGMVIAKPAQLAIVVRGRLVHICALAMIFSY